MKLRSRLTVATIAVTIPMIAALVVLDALAQKQAAEDELVDIVSSRAARANERRHCERDPQAWDAFRRHDGSNRPHPPPPFPPRPAGAPRAGHSAPADFFVYDEAFRPHRADAPDLPQSLREDIATQATASRGLRWNNKVAEVLLRTPWGEGACAYVLATGTTEPWLGGLLPPTRIWLAPVLLCFVAILLAVGPVLTRIRRLTSDVRRLAATDYDGHIVSAGDDEVAELARAFEVAGRQVRAQLEQRDRREQALRDFLANTTHDVMIPLTVLQGHLAALRDGLESGQTLDPAVLTFAMEQTHYMASLMHNLATVAKLDVAEPQLQVARVDLCALVSRVAARHRPIARQLQVGFEAAIPDESLITSADVAMLEQCVSNVVYNAIRHNDEDGHVAVILEPMGQRFRLRILDDGPGLEPSELERLLERGVRGNTSRTRAPEGQGLGLDIACRVASLHGFALTFSRSDYGGLQVDLEGDLSVMLG